MNRQQRFYSTMQKGLQKLNVSDNNLKSLYPQKLETKYGKLLIHIPLEKIKLYTCYTIFEDVDKAKEYMGCIRFNRFNGKWNFHIVVKNNKPEDVAKEMLREIRNITYFCKCS